MGWATINARTKGMLIMLGGVLAITPDALLVRLMKEELQRTIPDVQRRPRNLYLQVIFWKYVFATCWNLMFTVWHEGGCTTMGRKMVHGPRHIVLGAMLQVTISVSLMISFMATLAARSLLFFALSPLWTAALSRVFLGDLVPWRTAMALLLAMGAMAVVFVPSYNAAPLPPTNATGAGSPSASDRGSLYGDLCGVLAGAALGAMMTLGRSAKLHAPNAAMLACVWIGSALCVIFALAWQTIAALEPMVDVTQRFIGLALADSLCSCFVYIATVLAPRYATSAEVSLINLLETILGPLWVFAGLGEAPTVWTLAGGASLVVILAAHELWGCLDPRTLPATSPPDVILAVEGGSGGGKKGKFGALIATDLHSIRAP